MKKFLLIMLFAAAVIGCKVGPKYERSDSVQRKLEYGQQPGNKDSMTNMKWFDIYQDEALKQLIQLAIDSNRSVLEAISKVEEAQAAAAIVKSNLFPQLNYGVGGAVVNPRENSNLALGGQNLNVYHAKAMLNWEIDLFGKIRNNKEAAVNEYLSREEVRKNIQVSLVAEVASNYFLLRDLDNRLAIAERTILARKESLRIISERFSKGYIAEIDKLQAEQQLAVAEAMRPNLKRQIITIENNLNVLCGKSSGQIVRGKTNYEQKLPPTIPVGLPSELLERRPDIKSAEYTVEAQYRRVGIAVANRFPTLSLTAALGIASNDLSTLASGNSLFNNAGAQLAGPIFAFGQNKRRVEVERKRAEQANLKYEQTVLIAFAEVESTLGQYANLGEEYDARSRQVTAAKRALDLSNQRYNTGYTTYLEVLVQENNLFDAELQESSVLQQKHNALVSLYKALGGGW